MPLKLKTLKGKAAARAFVRAMTGCFDQLGENEQDEIYADMLKAKKTKPKTETSRFYDIKNHPTDFQLCPLCNSKLQSCHIGSYCGQNGCPYVDGIASLTPNEAEKHKDKLETL